MNAGLVGLFGDYDDDEPTTQHLGLILDVADTSTASDRRSSDDDEAAATAANEATLAKTTSLPPEVERGNIEYKLKLVDPTPVRFEHLVTQMKWRLQEGFGEAIYEIGVSDDGYLKVCN